MANSPESNPPSPAGTPPSAGSSEPLEPDRREATPPARDPMDPKGLLGKVVNGKYEVLSLLGEGGMGVVYKVRHLLLQNKNLFALKILHPRFSADREFQTRFLREVEVTMELTHENIIQIRDFGMTEEGHLFFTMDYFPGESLKAIVGRGTLPVPRALSVLMEVLQALDEAHKAGIIHRDLKPDNILVESLPGGGERVRILDFGIAKILGEGGEQTLTGGNLIGTPKYMSPEQAAGEPVDERSDLYSLGVILYEMLAGRAPFTGGTTRSILMNHLTAPPPTFRQVRPDLEIPPFVEKLVFSLLAKDREKRPQSAARLIQWLREEATVRGPVPRRRRRVPAAALGLVSAGLLAGLLALGRYFPWRSWFVPGAAAESNAGDRPLDAGQPPAAAPGSEGSAVAPAPPAPARNEGRRGQWRCEICGREYSQHEKVGNMCHGLPLLRVEG